ncbi:sulfotransferase 2B1-like [Boleophthalmus pectinirostris]|uniref:sulfotransferase 2B1-like n=1 Tax=Boleophthalmus pectinirostris TaxID=150288 RepID=UPI002433329C|nr:sulfotransferase 2B1-like [Boleophthalmus pectinirostris]
MVDPNFYNFYQGMHVPSFFYTPESLKHWEDFTFRPDDVIVATYPKSGTNWAMEMVPLVLSGGDSSLVDSVATWERSAGIGHVQVLGRDLENRPSPRFFATHYHYHALPKSFYQVKPKDLPQVVRRTAEFLEKPLDEEQVDRIADRCLFKNMKKHNNKAPAAIDHSKFYRKGIAGDWKNHLSEEEVQHFDSVYKEKMKDVDFKFPWD